MSFCSLTKGITPKICRLCVCVLINEHSFEPVMCLARTAVDAKRVYTNTNVLFSMSIFERGSDVKQWYRNTNNRLSTVNQQTIELITVLLTSNRHNDKDRIACGNSHLTYEWMQGIQSLPEVHPQSRVQERLKVELAVLDSGCPL